MEPRLLTTLTVRALPIVLLIVGAFASLAAGAATDKGNPFDQLKGDWTGGGIVTPAKGGTKKVTCKVSYDVAGNATTQSMVCNGDDYQFDAKTKFKNNGGKLSGSWNEVIYDASGNISGTAGGDTVHARISGDKFSGRMSIVVSADRHTINMVQLDPKTNVYRESAAFVLHR
jgi:hypothetical protein